jgi:hypothetical protein
MSHAWHHRDMNPTYPQDDAIVLSTLHVVRAASVVAAKEGSATAQAVSLARLFPQRHGFDSRSVSLRFMARSIVTTLHSPPEEVFVGQLQPCYSQNTPNPIFCYLTFEFLTAALPFKPRIKSHLLFAGIISSPFSPR